jgi:hypothetical protein
VKARLRDGSVIDLVKDCDCRTHEGPHWLHMDEMSKRLNAPLRGRAMSGDLLAIRGLAIEEIARLREKRYQMESRNITELIVTSQKVP